ncbi:MAG: 4-hydroxybenzoate octaprenyltransferase [Bacteroides sp.]|nr:MAG: 4-hydroxybenzoate octaprenyltransferase [Bacteroides sp.]
MKHYFSLIKVFNIFLSIPFGILGFLTSIYIYNYEFNIINLLLSLVCIITARNAAIAFNRLIDLDIDKKNIRTINRVLSNNLIYKHQIIMFIVYNLLIFFLSSYFINKLCFYLSPIAAIIIMSYSYSKRYTYLCHFYLGISLSIVPIGAFIASSNNIFALLPYLLSFSVFLWITGFDIIYATQDIDFDRKENIYSIPSKIGFKKSLLLSYMLYMISVLVKYIIGYIYNFHYYYFIGLILYFIIMHIEIYISIYKKNYIPYISYIHCISGLIYFLFTTTDFLLLHK